MKKQLLLGLSLIALIITKDANAYMAYGRNLSKGKVHVTLLTNVGGWTWAPVEAGQDFAIGDYDRCFYQIKAEARDGALNGQVVYLDHIKNQCGNADGVQVYEENGQLKIKYT